MARRSSSSSPSLALLTAAALHSLSLALQVTPNSPCASFCLDSSGLDRSDPNSSTTEGGDIACQDDDFGSEEKGQKFQRCLSCLQDSAFEQGSENDQDWFLYNLRYSFDYCVFGYPNASDVGSNPCVTSEACGGLETALKEGILDPEHREQYDYCEADGGSMTGPSYEKCLACVRADQTHIYVSNFLIALEAGCQQRPSPGAVVGLNDTVFTKTALEIIDATSSSDGDGDGAAALPTPTIVGIAIAALVVSLLAAGCLYMQFRKRRNRADRTRRVRASSLSFRCQTHLTPRAAAFVAGREDEQHRAAGMDEKPPYMDASAPDGYSSPSSSSSLPPNAAVGGIRSNPRLTSITTTLPCPPPVHSSPKMVSPDDYTTPTSTTSTRSNAPLLHHRPYNPADHAVSPPLASPPLFSPGFGVSSPRPSSPFAAPNHASSSPGAKKGPEVAPLWEDQHLVGTGRDLMVKKKASWGATAPVEARNIQVVFPPPPKNGR